MQATLQKIEAQFIHKHFDGLVAARDRANAVDTADMRLGEGERAELLAATGAASIEEIVQGAKVVKRLKRSALIQVHNLLYYCNPYGVMICTVPAEFVIGRFNAVWGPSITFAGGPQILERLGVKREWGPGNDELYNYSACEETPVDWLQ